MADRRIVIVMGRCCRAKSGFGVRFERTSAAQWNATWAFGIKPEVARKEGYDKSKIDGSFQFDAAYPGCPHCRARSVFQCSCGKISCWNATSRTVTCPWCGITGELSGQIESMEAGGDL